MCVYVYIYIQKYIYRIQSLTSSVSSSSSFSKWQLGSLKIHNQNLSRRKCLK